MAALSARTCGTITTTYKFTAKLDENFVELMGRCEHPITGGTGDFEGITGRFDFKDDVDTWTFYYRAHINLP